MQDKKQKIQIAVLAVLILACLAYGGMVFMGKKSTAPPPQAQTEQSTQPKTSETVPIPNKTVFSAAVAETPAQAQGNPRDPFMPMMQTMVTPAPSTSTRRFNNTPVPPIGVTIPLGAGGGDGSSANQTSVAESFPQFQLTGVITGQTNVAIIRLGESRYIVKEGQKIDGQYEVTSVSQEGVLLSRGGRSVFLKLGGDGNANKS